MSALGKLEKLMYSIGVIDKVTGPVNKIMGKINQLKEQSAGAQEQMMRGMMGVTGGAMMLVGSLSPAIAANQALGEVKSLDVADGALQQLNQTAINFTTQYGGNSADVIRSSYDIQSSIAGLSGEELSAFTQASAVMAKGTKSDASTATNYLGTMYGIYQNNAEAMGKNAWVEQLAGQTATAVRMFKTNGNEMSSAFSSLGANAQSHGIEMSESMAILGQLQSTMSGSEAGTKYKAFLSGVGNAQKTLGIQLTDNQGKLLPMVDVLERIQGKFGQVDTVAKSDALKKAFGSEEAVALVKLLMPQVDQLRGNIQTLNEQTGMETAKEMADAQTDAWQRLSGSFNAAGTTLGQAVLPIIEPVVDVLASLLRGVVWLAQEFPTLTGLIAACFVGATALMILFSAFNLVMGLYRFALLSSGAAVGFFSAVMKGLQVVMAIAKGTALLFNAVLLANPIGFVITAVMLLIAGIAGLIVYWDKVVSWFKDVTWWDVLQVALGGVFGSLFGIVKAAKWALEALGLIDGAEVEAKVTSQTDAQVKEMQGQTTTVQQAEVTQLTATQSHVQQVAPRQALAANSPVLPGDNRTLNLHDNHTPQLRSLGVQLNPTLLSDNAQIDVSPVKESMQEERRFDMQMKRSKTLQQLTQNATTNNQQRSTTDNSKRLYIDNVNLQSNNPEQDLDQLMELAG
ncbi:phage tail tape measure protein [Algicola sagamiensis]|uniref:phage tail tape measure protein n=1 Tax=Algicola sagamiensis TaxID=163869 RepID=UPI00037384C7|nr:phage tail tape measure protein [Algicola sagamiensis]